MTSHLGSRLQKLTIGFLLLFTKYAVFWQVWCTISLRRKVQIEFCEREFHYFVFPYQTLLKLKGLHRHVDLSLSICINLFTKTLHLSCSLRLAISHLSIQLNASLHLIVFDCLFFLHIIHNNRTDMYFVYLYCSMYNARWTLELSA